MPGEAQKIDRIVEAFADAFFVANSKNNHTSAEEAPSAAEAVKDGSGGNINSSISTGNSSTSSIDINSSNYVFASASTAHILSFSVIMLNTDAHSPNMRAKERMSKEQFVRNNRGIDDGKDLPRPMLEAIYDDITKNEVGYMGLMLKYDLLMKTK